MPDNSRKIEQAVKREKSKLYNFIRKNVKVKEDAEDILQDVFYQLASGFGEIEFLEKISVWLMITAKNKITDRQRRKSSGKIVEDRAIFLEDSSGEPVMLSEIIPDISALPDEVYWRDYIWEEIEKALDELPEEQREVFILNEFDEYSFREISEMKGIPLNTLLSRKRYAVLFLRKKLEFLYKELK